MGGDLSKFLSLHGDKLRRGRDNCDNKTPFLKGVPTPTTHCRGTGSPPTVPRPENPAVLVTFFQAFPV